MTKTLTLACSALWCCGLAAQSNIDRYLTDPLTYTNIVTSSDQVSNPRDLDFKPGTNELWVMLRGSSNGGSFVIVHDAGLPTETDEYRKDTHSGHFMIQASALAFSPNGEFAAVNEVQNTSTPTSTFMGPALWNSDLNIFAEVFQNNWVSGLPLGSHIDMLHQSPFAMGIAADSAKVYWVMDGHFGTICRYDFVQDHGPGYDYHGAGKIWRYTDVPVTRVPNIPSHMVLDRENGWLYFIDGGAKQVKRLNVHTGAETGNLSVPSTSVEPLAGYKKVEGANVEIVDTWTTQPCGIEYHEGRLLVSDHTNGEIRIYDVTGTPSQMGIISTGQNSIMGIKVGPDGRIWFVNNTGNKVVRIDPNPLANNAAIHDIVSPVITTANNAFYSIADMVCGPSVTPEVKLANTGSNTLTSAEILAAIDGNSAITFNWSGSLAPGASVNVTLPAHIIPTGPHTLEVWTAQPNGNADAIPGDDRLAGSFRTVDPVQSLPFNEGFDGGVVTPTGWDYIHYNPNCFISHNASVGGFGTSQGCLKMDNYSGDMDITGQNDYLILPRIDLSNATPGTAFEFAVAHRPYNSSSTDKLMVKSSVNCGDTWNTIYDKEGTTLATGTSTTSAFTPTATQWRTESIDLAGLQGQPDVLFMFQTTSDYGNNVYIDDVHIGNVVGIDEHEGMAFGLFPNPNNGSFSVRASDASAGAVNVRVIGLDGTLVQQINWPATQGAVLDLDLGDVARGSYVVEVAQANGRIHHLPMVVN